MSTTSEFLGIIAGSVLLNLYKMCFTCSFNDCAGI